MPADAPTPRAAEPPHPWGPHIRIGKVFIKGNKRTKCVAAVVLRGCSRR